MVQHVTCINALNSIVSSTNLGLLEPFDGSCFGHALSKVYQYVIIKKKNSTNVSYAS